MATKTLPAGEFKQRCLAILDEVKETHGEVVITKRGKPVARLVPIASEQEQEERILAELRGRGRLLTDLESFIGPTTADAGWGEDASE